MTDQQLSKTILVVDDDVDVRDAHALYLQFHDFKTYSADNGLSAHDVLASEHVDLILSDIKMPREDGYTFCQKVRMAEERYGQIPFMFVSALTSLDEKIRGYAVGADDYVTKPVDPDELIVKIDYLIALYGKREHINRPMLRSNCLQPKFVETVVDCINEFIDSSGHLKEMDAVMAALYQTVSTLGLRAVFQVETGEKARYFSDTDVSSPLERNIMQMARRNSHYYQYGTTSIVSSKRASVLFNGLWYNDQQKQILEAPLTRLVNSLEAAYFTLAEIKIIQYKQQDKKYPLYFTDFSHLIPIILSGGRKR